MNINGINKICIFIIVLQWLPFPVYAADADCSSKKTVQPETRIYTAAPADLDILLPKLKKKISG